MDAIGDDARASRAPTAMLAHMPTGAKLFLILIGALFPLAAFALIATLQTGRMADYEARSRLRVAAGESARALAIELIGDMTALRVALNALDADPGDAPSCARAQGVFAQQAATGTRFTISDRSGRLLCGVAPSPGMDLVPPADDRPITARVVPGRGLALAMSGSSGKVTATAIFPTQFLAQIGRPSGFNPVFSATLDQGSERLSLDTIPDRGPLDRFETTRVPLNFGDLTYEMSVRSAPITFSLILALLLPLLMWLAAASIAWFVVDRLLIRPLQRLRANVAAYRPGEEIDPGEVRSMPAAEIRELGETFRTISGIVAVHEADLAEGLVRQTKLTREVHHRVKNNLQVISSLINFHARGAKTEEASEAYASIQRRVDALAVVHRNHFAELEVNRGLSLRSVIGELASNIRATAPESSSGLGIVLDVEPYLVNQDVAIAIAFLITEMVELAMNCNAAAQIRIAARPGEDDGHAVLRMTSTALIDCARLRDEVGERYGRVMEGLSRQLRSRLHHDPLVGAYEIAVAVLGRD